MATTRSLTYNGITWSFTSDVTYGTYINGDYWVLGNPLTGVELSSISPACVLGPLAQTGQLAPFNTQYEDRNGSMINPHFARQRITYPNGYGGFDSQTIQGFHGSGVNLNWPAAKNYFRSENFSILQSAGSWVNISNTNRKILPVNSSLVSCDSTIPGGVSWFGGTPRTSMKYQSILTCVSAVPSDGSFRPAYSIASKASLITSGDLDYSYLGNIVASSVSALMPSSTYFNYLTSATKYPFMAYMRGGYPTFGFDGVMNTLTDGYGEYIATINNTALGYVNTNLLSTTNKAILANYLIQRGIDLFGSLENAFLTSSTIGLPHWSNDGGHNNSFEGNLVFLAGMLRPGTVKERVKSALNVCKNALVTTGDNVFARDGQLFTVTYQDYLETTVNGTLTGTVGMPPAMTNYSQYNSVSSYLVYQTSDIGLIDWRNNPTQYGAYKSKKVWSADEFRFYTSSLPGYSPADAAHFYTGYKHCCTAIVWAPLILAYKAMGIEKITYNDLQARYFERYFRRQSDGPNPEGGTLGGNLGRAVSLYSVSTTTFPIVGSVATFGLDALYAANVKHSFVGPRNGTVSAAMPVSGVQSIGLPSVSSIYIDVSSPIRAGANNTIFCRGMSNYASTDYMLLFIGEEGDILDNPIKILGVDLYLNAAAVSYGFTLVTGASTAQVTFPIVASGRGAVIIMQALLIRSTASGLEVRATNAIKATVI